MCGKYEGDREKTAQEMAAKKRAADTRIHDGMGAGIAGVSSGPEQFAQAGRIQPISTLEQIKMIFDQHEKMLHYQLEQSQQTRRMFEGMAMMSPENSSALVRILARALSHGQGPF